MKPGELAYDDSSTLIGHSTSVLSNDTGTEGSTNELRTTTRFCVFNTGALTRSEFWDYLKLRLAHGALQRITKVKVITQPNGRRRIDFWAEREVSQSFKTALHAFARDRRNGVRRDNQYPLREFKQPWFSHNKSSDYNFESRKWRLDFYRPNRDSPPQPKQFNAYERAPLRCDTFMTWNANGSAGRMEDLKHLLWRRRVAVCVVQETLQDEKKKPFDIPGYRVFHRHKHAQFRGQAILVHESLSAYEILDEKSDNLIYVKVAGLYPGAPFHVFGIYMPSGGWHRADRTVHFKSMYKRVETILAKEPEARIIAPGDYNEISSQVARRAKGRKKKQLLHLNRVSGSRLSFFRKGTKPSAIDHMLEKMQMTRHISGSLLRTWRTECDRPSDHTSLEAKVRLPKQTLDETWTLVGTSTKPELVRTHQHALVFHNRWSSLPVEDITTQEELDDAAVDFSDTVEKTGLELGFVAKRSRRRYRLNRVLAKHVKKVQVARKAWRTAVDKFADDADELHLVYQAALKAKKAAVGKNEKKKRTANVRKVIDMCHRNDMKSFWRWEKEMTSGTEPSIMVTPIWHANGSLLTNESEILGRTTEYYKALAQDDPRKLSQDKEYWAGKCKRPR
ncbi:Endonuclease/exonuclease/phosphatase [Mycena leptocephala]|nr:Endonuclease/exonuclease/phosphatase [Mycena leptocephala]